MIELPEARTLARQLAQTCVGRTVTGVGVLESPHRFAFLSGGGDAYPGLLTGQPLTGSRAHGGLVFVEIGDHTLILGDGAFPRRTPPGGTPPAKRQLRLDLDDGSTLTVTVRMYGGVHLWELDRDNPYIQVALDRPGPLDDTFDEAWVAGLFAEPGVEKLSVKAFLATDQRIPGVGNGLVQDTAWRAEVNPRTRIGALSAEQHDALIEALRETAGLMVAAGGRDTEPGLDGTPGGYHGVLGKATVGTPCPRCSATIVKEAFLGGAIYYCPGCQPKG